MLTTETLSPNAEPRIIASLDEHPTIQRRLQKRGELVVSLAAAKAEHEQLLRERSRVAGAQHEAAVAFHLGDNGQPPDEPAERLAQVETEIVQAAARVAALTDAIGQFDVITRGVRRHLTAEHRAQQFSAAQAVVEAMAPRLAELAAWQADLQQLRVHVPAALAQLLMLLPLAQREARAFCQRRAASHLDGESPS